MTVALPTAVQLDPITAEFDRQVETLLDHGYPALARMSAAEFAAFLAPLRAVAAEQVAPVGAVARTGAPLVLVISTSLVPPAASMPLTRVPGRSAPGFVDASAADIDRFVPIETVEVPVGGAYLLIDVDRGGETLNVRPNDALVTIAAQGRTPLTVDEGIALITTFPALLEKNNCFSLLGSRCGDKRIPALWISKNAPKLGWCWAGNPHTWLGSASAAARVGVPPVRLASTA